MADAVEEVAAGRPAAAAEMMTDVGLVAAVVQVLAAGSVGLVAVAGPVAVAGRAVVAGLAGVLALRVLLDWWWLLNR